MAVGGRGRLTGLSWARSIVGSCGGAAQSFGSYYDQSTSKRFTPPVERGLPLHRTRMTLTHDFAPVLPVVPKGESPGMWIVGAAPWTMLFSGDSPSGWRGSVAHGEQVMVYDAASSSPESRSQPVSVRLGLGSSPRRVQSALERDPPPLGPRRASTTGRQGNRCALRATNTCPAHIPPTACPCLHSLHPALAGRLVGAEAVGSDAGGADGAWGACRAGPGAGEVRWSGSRVCGRRCA